MASDSTGEGPVHTEVQAGQAKGLLLLVKVLGIIMLLLFVALVGGIIWKATHKAPTVPVADVVLDLGFDPASIRHFSLDGNTLAMATDKEILVVDIAKRKVILRSSKP